MTPSSKSLPRLLGVVAVLLAGSCGVQAGETGPSASSGSNHSGQVIGGGVRATTTTSTTLPELPEANVEIVGDDGSELNRVIANAVVDLETFWEEQYPQIYDEPYKPLSGGLFAIDSSTDPSGIPCAGNDISELLNNAFYCPPSDAVVWDQEQFMVELADQYGAFTAAVVIAHEWGHVIQARSEFEAPSVTFELQADCFAGAWSSQLMEREDSAFELTSTDLDRALAGILSLRDAPGGTADDPMAHGSGFDRVGAFQDGFEHGPSRCAMFDAEDPMAFQWPFSVEEFETGGDLPLSTSQDSDDILDLTFPALDSFWSEALPQIADGQQWNPMGEPVAFEDGDNPSCNGEEVSEFVLFVCIPDRFVAFEVGSVFPALYEQNGDFGVATLIATQYGLDVTDQLQSADNEVAATLQGDCFAGAWAQALLPDSTGASAYDLVLSPGDLDEAVSALLSFRSASDRDRQGPGFDRVKAFRTGVMEGAISCLEIEGN